MNRDTPFQLFFYPSSLSFYFSFHSRSPLFILTIFLRISYHFLLSFLFLNTVVFPFLSPSTIISTGINEHTASHCFDIPHTGFHSSSRFFFPIFSPPPFFTLLAYFSFYFPPRSQKLPFLSRSNFNGKIVRPIFSTISKRRIFRSDGQQHDHTV